MEFRHGFVCVGTEGQELGGGRVSFVASRKDAIITPCLTEDCKRRLSVSIYCIFLPPPLKRMAKFELW